MKQNSRPCVSNSWALMMLMVLIRVLLPLESFPFRNEQLWWSTGPTKPQMPKIPVSTTNTNIPTLSLTSNIPQYCGNISAYVLQLWPCVMSFWDTKFFILLMHICEMASQSARSMNNSRAKAQTLFANLTHQKFDETEMDPKELVQSSLDSLNGTMVLVCTVCILRCWLLKKNTEVSKQLLGSKTVQRSKWCTCDGLG